MLESIFLFSESSFPGQLDMIVFRGQSLCFPLGTSEPKDAGPAADGEKRGGKRYDLAWWKRLQKVCVCPRTRPRWAVTFLRK